MTALTIADIRIDRIDDLRELWLALHRYHGEIGSWPLVADEALSWEMRRGEYERWLRSGEGFVLLAEREERPVGYAGVRLRHGPDDTYPVGERWAEIHSLSVAPDARGQGIGSALLDGVDERLRALGIHDVSISAMLENEAALRLYQRRGFVPREIVLFRFGSRL